ncbi:MAG: hypothetical protein R6T97_07470 [Yoonia sp.]
MTVSVRSRRDGVDLSGEALLVIEARRHVDFSDRMETQPFDEGGDIGLVGTETVQSFGYGDKLPLLVSSISRCTPGGCMLAPDTAMSENTSATVQPSRVARLRQMRN